jgi:hypothetical protein
MTATRTDVHAPASPDFDPELYDCYGVFDFTPEWDYTLHVETRRETVNAMLAKGYRFGGSTTGGCGHCGTNIRYGALMARDDVMEMIWVGETCLDNRFDGMTKAEFQKLRKNAALGRERLARQAAFEALCDANPDLAYATYAGNIHDAIVDEHGARFGNVSGTSWALSTLIDIADKARKYGDPSPRQLAFVSKLIGEVSEKADAYAAQTAEKATEAPAASVPTGKRVQVTGTVIKVDWKENAYGSRQVMTVKHADGWLVWGSVPKSLNTDANGYITANSGVKAGDAVTFTATVEASDRPEFGWYSRPTKATKMVADK